MREVLRPAFVLHRKPYRDTSLLLEILTREHGRLGMIARGARRGARKTGLLQPFKPLLLSWVGKDDLGTLTTVEEVHPALSLAPGRLLSVLYVNELLLRLLQRCDPHPELFDSYLKAISELAAGGSEEPILRVFEKRLLAELGYGLSLETEALTHGPIEPGELYRYVLDQGPVAAARAKTGVEITGSSLLALHSEKLEEATVLRETKRLMRAAIDWQLQGRALKTRELARFHWSGPAERKAEPSSEPVK